jgi:hypothetical protein
MNKRNIFGDRMDAVGLPKSTMTDSEEETRTLKENERETNKQ